VKVEIAYIAEIVLYQTYALISGATKPLILSQHITLVNKKKLPTMSDTM